VRVALYTRVSTDNQLGEEGSLDTQEARLRAAVAARGGGHVIGRVFREEGASGKNLDRPALQEMLASVNAGQVDLVMVTRLDRLSRSLLDFYELHRAFETRGVQFVSLNETFDTSSPVGRAMLKLVLVFAELEREQTADRTRVAMQARAERGLWNGGPPPLGYDSDGNGHLSVNEAEAAVVRAAYEKMLELRSIRNVTRWLNAQGHRQKRYASRRRGDKGERLFNLPVVEVLLRNRLYLGEVPHRGTWHAGQHPPIVDEVTYERVQNVREDNRRGARNPRGERPHAYLLTGLARCAACDMALTSATTTNKIGQRYHYYRCVATSKEAQSDCPVRQLPADALEDAVFAIVRRAASDPALVERAAAESNRIASELLEPARARLKALQSELAANTQERNRLLDALLALGAAGVSTARDRMVALETRATALQASIAEEEGRLDVESQRSLSLASIHEVLRDFDALQAHFTAGERREFLHEIVDEVRVHPDRVEVALYDGTHAAAPLAQAKRRARKVGGGGAAGGDGAEGGALTGTDVHAVHAAVHAGAAGREPAGKTTNARRTRVEFAERVEWLPLAHPTENIPHPRPR
jgi:DNA invertase Pin-like site-specific DNA recombinase